MSKLGDFLHDLPYDLELLRLKKFDKKIEKRFAEVGIDWNKVDSSLFFRCWVRDNREQFENPDLERLQNPEYFATYKEYRRLKRKHYPNGYHDPFDEDKAITLPDSEVPVESDEDIWEELKRRYAAE